MGSTELMRDLDPEETRTVIDPALKLIIDAVRRYDCRFKLEQVDRWESSERRSPSGHL